MFDVHTDVLKGVVIGWVLRAEVRMFSHRAVQFLESLRMID